MDDPVEEDTCPHITLKTTGLNHLMLYCGMTEPYFRSPSGPLPGTWESINNNMARAREDLNLNDPDVLKGVQDADLRVRKEDAVYDAIESTLEVLEGPTRDRKTELADIKKCIHGLEM